MNYKNSQLVAWHVFKKEKSENSEKFVINKPDHPHVQH